MPFTADVPLRRWPWVNLALIAVTLVSSLALLAGAESIPTLPTDRGLEGMRELGLQSRPLQLITHLFVHGSLISLLGSLLFLFGFGNAVNAKLGHVRYAALYLGAGVASGIVGLAAGAEGTLVGSPGALLAVAGAYLALYPLNDFWLLNGITKTNLKVALLALLVFLLPTLALSHADPKPALVPLLGLIYGLVATLALTATRLVVADSDEVTLWRLMRGHDRPLLASRHVRRPKHLLRRAA